MGYKRNIPHVSPELDHWHLLHFLSLGTGNLQNIHFTGVSGILSLLLSKIALLGIDTHACRQEYPNCFFVMCNTYEYTLDDWISEVKQESIAIFFVTVTRGLIFSNRKYLVKYI